MTANVTELTKCTWKHLNKVSIEFLKGLKLLLMTIVAPRPDISIRIKKKLLYCKDIDEL